MKITGTLRNASKGQVIFHVYFDDGMTINLRQVNDEEFVYANMLSTGLDSYYLRTGKWPKGKNLEKRVSLGSELITKNLKKNRYRIKKEVKEK